MFFTIGGFEILATAVFAIPALTLYGVGHPAHRWFSIASFAISAASILTPADLLTTAIVAVALMIAFVIGRRMALHDLAVAG